jgi:hypothetical protein
MQDKNLRNTPCQRQLCRFHRKQFIGWHESDIRVPFRHHRRTTPPNSYGITPTATYTVLLLSKFDVAYRPQIIKRGRNVQIVSSLY